MKKIIPIFSILLLTSCISNENTAKEDKIELKSFTDSLSYAFGSDIYKQISSNFPEIDFKILQAGLKNRSENDILLIDTIKCQKIIEDFMVQKQQEMMQKQQEMMQNQQELNSDNSFEEMKSKGEEFLAENGKRKNVITTESGLQYEIIVQGNGPKPTLTSTVETHYHGTLIDGTVFDSSVERGKSISFPVNGVIPGWTEALQLMPAGSKWKLYIPYQLAYGERGSGPIGPYSALIFEVELIKVN